MATATSTIDSRKCAATVHGLSPVSTVTPPSSAWAGMPSRLSTASRRRSRRTEAKTATTVATATTTSAKVSMPVAELDQPVAGESAVGRMLPSVHCGQVGQPSPEPVSRTAPPVTTITPLATTLARAMRETTDGFIRERNDAGRTDTLPMLLTAVLLAAGPDQPPGAPPDARSPTRQTTPESRCAASAVGR